MLQLNGVDQYGTFDDSGASPQGVPNFAALAWIGYPQWWMVDYRPNNGGLNRFVLDFGRTNGSSRMALQFQATTIQVNNGVEAFGGIPLTINDWNRILVCLDSRISATVYVNGVSGVEHTGDNVWPSGVNVFVVGARIENAAADIPASGDLANLALGRSKLPTAQRTSCVVGVNPLAMSGVCRNWPLKSDALDLFDSWPLTLFGAPNITAVGHPDVAAWPPATGSGVVKRIGDDGGMIG